MLSSETVQNKSRLLGSLGLCLVPKHNKRGAALFSTPLLHLCLHERHSGTLSCREACGLHSYSSINIGSWFEKIDVDSRDIILMCS